MSQTLRNDLRFQKIAAWVNFFVFVALLTHAYIMNGSLVEARKQSATTAEQLRQTERASTFNIIQQLRGDTFAMQEMVYDPTSLFEIARKTGCTPLPTMTREGASQIAKVISHYELYFRAAQLGSVAADEWRGVCLSAKDFFGRNCLLQDAWDQTYSKSEPSAFVSSFIPDCNLVEEAQ